MKNPASTNANKGLMPVKSLQDWKKPVLDILELENAEHGPKGLPDGAIRHRSAG